eukprot:369450_1
MNHPTLALEAIAIEKRKRNSHILTSKQLIYSFIMKAFLSDLKVGDKIDLYDDEQWKVAIIKDINTSTRQYQFHLSFDRYYERECHIDSWFERQEYNRWISCDTTISYNKIIQPLNTHTAHHDNTASKSCHNLSYDICKKCRRKCCLSCFIVRDYGNSTDSNSNIYCKQCLQICHKQQKCDYIHGNKCSQCNKENICMKCSYIHIYNKLNGKLISRQCYECYPLIQSQLIFIIAKSMFNSNSSSKINIDTNILKLITNYVFNTILHCKYHNCPEYMSASIPKNKRQYDYNNISLFNKNIICSNIDPNCVFICNVHAKERSMYTYCHHPGYEALIHTVDTSYINQTKLRCGTIENYHYPANTAQRCYHCEGNICIVCDKIIKCTECGKVCHHSKCDYQDYIVLGNNNYYTQLIQCKDCHSIKVYKNQLDITKIICKSMVVYNTNDVWICDALNIDGNHNIIELITNYYFSGDLTLKFLVQPLTHNTAKNGSWCIDDESGYFGQITKLKVCCYGKHGHSKILFKMIIPFTGQILNKMIYSKKLTSLKRCVIDNKNEYIFIKYVDKNDKKLVECKNKITGEFANINISCLEKYYSKVTDLIDKKKENDTLILYVLNGPRYYSKVDQLESVQCIVDAKIEQDVYDVMD